MKSEFQAQAVLNTARGISMAGWVPRLSLWIGDPLLGGVEVVGGGYGRMLLIFGAPSGMLMTNTNLIVFATPTGTWGELTHTAIMDAPSGGNIRQADPLQGTPEQRTVLVGVKPPSFAPGTVIYREG